MNLPANGQPMISPGVSLDIGVQVLKGKQISVEHSTFLKRANLSKLAPVEAWVVRGTNSQINYSTHGIYRYFGKFPAPIAAKLIDEYTSPGELVIDPACGSGTTGVEALHAGRTARLNDINPLSVLISKVKTTPLATRSLEAAVERLHSRFVESSVESFTTDEINLDHWFLPETIHQLTRLKDAISRERNRDLRDFLLMVFASIIRRVSRATTQQGRLFLDVDTAVEQIWPIFEKAAKKASTRIGLLPQLNAVEVVVQNILDNKIEEVHRANLVIYHPPYFNAYKYSSINSLEMAWLNFGRKEIRSGEIREFFKIGKPDNAAIYVDDMVRTLENIRRHVQPDGIVAMMIGDALMKGQHVDVTAQIISRIQQIYAVEKIAVRIPKYTEATWASSQRRSTAELGVTMFDYVAILRAR